MMAAGEAGTMPAEWFTCCFSATFHISPHEAGSGETWKGTAGVSLAPVLGSATFRTWRMWMFAIREQVTQEGTN